jgi:hypothetical protein
MATAGPEPSRNGILDEWVAEKAWTEIDDIPKTNNKNPPKKRKIRINA